MKHLLGAQVVTLVAVVLAGLATVPAAQAGVRDCNVQVFGPSLVVTSARSMSCVAAARDIRRSASVCCQRRFISAGRFACRLLRGGEYAGEFRCVRGGRAYRFEASE